MAKLVCLGGINKGEVYPLDQGDNTIGRGEGNSIRIYDKKSSRNHCKIVRDGDTLMFIDLNSTNGSRVNNAFAKTPIKLTMGDHIHIGQTVFLVSDGTRPDQRAADEEVPASTRERYAQLLRKTAFKVSETTSLRRLKNEKSNRRTGYLAFYQVESAPEEAER